MNACIIAIGSEMLTPSRVDTNSLGITERLNAIGCTVRFKAIVGDDIDELVHQLSASVGRVDLVVCTGGLGPTEDDVTREAIARVAQAPLALDERILDRIRSRFSQRGLAMPEINRRQAMVPRGAVLLENAQGTAPGLWLDSGRAAILALPGPPREMAPMLDTVIKERLAMKAGPAGVFRRVIRITGRTESDVDATAQPIYSRWVSRPVPIETTILAASGQIELHLTAVAPSPAAAEQALEAAAREVRDALGVAVYSVDGRPMEAVVGELLRSAGLTVAVAESCTGGLLTSRLTDVPGSSDYVDRGVVCYSNRAKIEIVGVPEALIAEHGAVSEPVARAMADGVRKRAGTHVGIGVTGIAGPGGGTPDKPVGTVALAVATGLASRVRTARFLGGREMVKFQASQAAMDMLRRLLLEGTGASG
jgi:nicotinamide-nucleotide amidase